jgi:hypothetical protein
LSSARALRCSVKSGNERNPCCQLQVSGDTAPRNGEEGGDNVKSAWSFDALGHTRATMESTKGRQPARGS